MNKKRLARDIQEFINGVNAPVILLDDDLSVIFTNRIFRQEYHIPIKMLSGLPLKELVIQPELNLKGIKKKVSEGKQKVSLPLRFHPEGREVIEIWGGLSSVKLLSGKRYCFLTIRDYPGLFKSNIPGDYAVRSQYLLNILEGSIDAIIFVDKNNRIKAWNSGAEKIFGYQKDEVIGKSFNLLVPEQLLKAKKMTELKSVLKDTGFYKHYRSHLLKKEGSTVLTESSWTVIKNDNGKALGSTIIVRDVSERAMMEAQLTIADRLVAVGHLATGFAHEIGTPLNVICGNAELLLMDIDEDDPIREELQTIIKQADRVSTLMRKLLEFAKRPAGEKKKVNIHKSIKEVIKFLSKQLQRDRVRVNTKFMKGKPAIYASSEQMEQVFLNMLMNAWSAVGENGTITIRSYSRPTLEGEDICVDIEDDGCGMRQELVKHIFNPFFSTKEPGKGTGLGLSICHGIIRDHKGQIIVDSEIDRGTKFTITIPRHVESK